MNHTTGPDLDEGTDFTLEAFVRFPSFPGGYADIVSGFGGDVLITPLENDQARLDLIVGAAEYDGGIISDTLWHHIAITTDGTNMSLWVDGLETVTATAWF